MSKENELKLKISADADAATKEINRLNKTVGTLTKQVKKSSSATKSHKTSFDSLATSTKNVTGLLGKVTLGLGAMGIAVKGVEFANLAADAEQAGDAFDKVVTEMGANAEHEFAKIKEAAQGLIPDAAIKQSATTALSLGVPLTKLSELMEVARAKSREMGTDAKAAFNDLAKGIGRGSPLILDNLGLTIKLGEANEKMATSLGKTVKELTKEEKTLALTNAVIEAGATSVERYGDAALTSKEKMQKMNASLDNLKVAIGTSLLPLMSDLTEAVGEWAEGLNGDDVAVFGETLKTLSLVVVGLFNALKTLNDIAMPDWLGGEGAGLLGTVAEGWGKIATIVNELTYNFTELDDAVSKQTDSFNEVTSAYMQIGKSAEEIDKVQAAILALMAENEKIIAQDMAGDSIQQAEARKVLVEQTEKLKTSLENLNGDRALLEMSEDADKAEESVKKTTEVVKKLSNEELKALAKVNAKRLRDGQRVLKSLEKEEAKLKRSIVKINEDLAKELNTIATKRFEASQSIDQRIRDLKRGALNEDKAYYAAQHDAEEALSQAKLALKNEEYAQYRVYIQDYEKLVTDSAGREIKVNDRILVSEEQTRKTALDGLKNIKTLEVQYYTQKESAARNAAKTATTTANQELSSVQARIVKQKELIALLSKPTKSTHTVKDNVPEVISRINRLKVTTHSNHIVHVKEVISRAGGGPVPQKLAGGGVYTGSGRVPGYDPTDSDKVNAHLTGGENVTNRKASQFYGQRMMDDINSMRFPKVPGYAEGGLVGVEASSANTAAPLQPVVINMGGNSVSALMSPEQVMEALAIGIKRQGGM